MFYLKTKKNILIFTLIASAVVFSACHFGTDESFELSIKDTTSYARINPGTIATINCEQEVTKIEFFSGINLQTKEMYLKATYSHRIKHTTTLTISEISDGKYVVK